MTHVPVRDLPVARSVARSRRTTHGVTVSIPTDRTTLSIQPAPQLLGCTKPVALGHQLGDLVPAVSSSTMPTTANGRPRKVRAVRNSRARPLVPIHPVSRSCSSSAPMGSEPAFPAPLGRATRRDRRRPTASTGTRATWLHLPLGISPARCDPSRQIRACTSKPSAAGMPGVGRATPRRAKTRREPSSIPHSVVAS